MEHPEIDRIELLRGLDADELARTLIEYGLEGSPDPEIQALIARARTGDNEFSARVASDQKPQKRNQYIYQQHLKCQRRRGPVPTPRTRPVEDLPPERMAVPAHLLKLEVEREQPTRPMKSDWIHESLKQLLAPGAVRVLVVERPYANEPFVTKEQAAANTGNPLTDVRVTRSSRLRFDEAARLYDAMAFARNVLHRRMNAHLTIRWSAIDVKETDAPEKLYELLNRASKWFSQQKASRGCVWAHTAPLPDELLWVYVHEKSATYGFHTHVLLSMDLTQAKAFAAWSDGCLAQLVYRETIRGDATKLTRSYAKSEVDQDSSHWRWFKYITKQLDPDEEVQSPFSGKVVQARQIFDPRHLRARLPVTVMRLVGICRRLDRAAQDAAGFVSRLPQGLMLYNDSGFRIPCLVEAGNRGCPYECGHGHERHYRGLDLYLWLPSGDRDVDRGSEPQYLAFETAWDRLTEAEQCFEAAKGKKDKAAAGRALAEARTNFAIAEGVINLDRRRLMPGVVYYEGDRRPALRFCRSSADWDQQLIRSNLNADAAYEWFLQYLQGVAFIDIVPREKILSPNAGGRKVRRGRKLDWRRPTGRPRV